MIGYLNKFYLEGEKTTYSKARVLTGTEETVIHRSQDMGTFGHFVVWEILMFHLCSNPNPASS